MCVKDYNVYTDKVLAVFLTLLVVPRPQKAHPTTPLVQASLPLMELRSGMRKGDKNGTVHLINSGLRSNISAHSSQAA